MLELIFTPENIQLFFYMFCLLAVIGATIAIIFLWNVVDAILRFITKTKK